MIKSSRLLPKNMWKKHILFFLALTLIPVILVWLPFLAGFEKFWGIPLPQKGFGTIAANFDGPYYIVVAKSLYNPEYIQANYSFPLPAIYYAAHYPLYPLLIRLIAYLPQVNYIYAMILATILTTILAFWSFYKLVCLAGLKKEAMWLTLVFAIFPARWLIVRSIGSPEPLFLFLIMSSIYFFIKKKYWAAGIFGVMAQLTKPPGILLFFAYLIALIAPHWTNLAYQTATEWVKKLPWKAYPILLIPTALLALFIFYGQKYGNILAYFHSGDNIHLFFPPFQIFNPSQPWVGTFWLEEIIWLYLLEAVGVMLLIKQKQTAFASFAGIFFLSSLLVAHRDIARYSLPLVPFLFVAYHKFLSSNLFKWTLLILIIPIYLFSIAFISNNITPIGDWGPFL